MSRFTMIGRSSGTGWPATVVSLADLGCEQATINSAQRETRGDMRQMYGVVLSEAKDLLLAKADRSLCSR
jgi:hypothetical protein